MRVFEGEKCILEGYIPLGRPKLESFDISKSFSKIGKKGIIIPKKTSLDFAILIKLG